MENGRTGERENGRTGGRENGRSGEREDGRTGGRENGRTGRTGRTVRTGNGGCLGDHMVLRGSRRGLSRRQQSITGGLWKIDCQLTVS